MDDKQVGQQKEQAVAKAAAQLKEHFDSYAILACHSMDGRRTGHVFDWSGNVFSIIGMTESFKEGFYGCPGTDQVDIG